jgi:hypothetical protein
VTEKLDTSNISCCSWLTIARFIKDNQDQVHDLYLQVLQLCIALGMVNFGHFSLDGTKIKTNASKHSAMIPDPNKTTLGLGYFRNKNDSFWNMPDEELFKLAASELERIKF